MRYRLLIGLFLLLLLGFNSAEIANAVPNTPPSPASLNEIKTVVIDAGHGGKDPGCLGITTSKEKEITLDIALKLGEYIKENMPDVKVIYTRTTDIFLELDERAAIANKNNADLFICIHCNTACSFNKKTKKKTCNEEVIGTETYVMGLHKTSANLNVAKRENESILLEKNYQKRYDGFDPDSETGYILLTLQQSSFLKQSLNFATKIQKHTKEKAGRHDKGVQQAGFLVLWRTSMPSVLIETEFLSSTDSENYITSEKGQDNLTRSLFCAFREYKDETEGRVVKYNDEFENEKPFTVSKTADSPGKDSSDEDKTETAQNTKPEDKEVKQELAGTNGGTNHSEKPQEKIIESSVKKDTIKKTEEASAAIKKEDNAIAKTEVTPPKKDTLPKVDTTKKIPGVVVMSVAKDTTIPKKEKLPPFKIDTLKTVSTTAEKITYKVQFLSVGKRIPLLSDKFKGLKDVNEYMDGTTYKYTAGEFKTINEALQYRKQMQTAGHPDCFVVKFKDGIRMKN